MILGTMVACVAGIHLVDWDFTGELEVEYKGLARTYSLLLPADYHHSQRQYPVVLNFHGNGDCGDGFAMENSMTQEAPRRGYVLIYPDGVQTPNSTFRCKDRSWNAGTCCGEAWGNNAGDVEFTRMVLHDAQKRFRLLRDEVFVTGTSNGGSMALRIGCSEPVAG